MITYVKGNLFESPAQVLVNTVNTVGVMGKGIALEFKQIHPDMFEEYRKLCEQRKLRIGALHLFRTPHKWVLSFPTKEHWRQPSRVEYIEAGLRTFVRIYAEAGISSVAFPPLGCGNGQLDFQSQVRPLVEKYLNPLPIAVFVYPGRHAPRSAEHADVKGIRERLRSEPQSPPFEEAWSDIVELLEERRAFRTATKGTEFTAEPIEEPPTLVVRAGATTFKIDHEALLDFWQQLRQHGFAFARLAPEHYRVHYLIPVFQELSYVRRVEVSDADGNVSVALQLRPGSQAEQPDAGDLFTPRV